ncbi:ExeA family protein [Halovulum sp. GXIMD14794]
MGFEKSGSAETARKAGRLDIYTEYFGLTRRPFTLQPDPDFLFWSAQHKKAYAMLEYGVMTNAPITVITGEIGAGKTTLVRHLLRNLEDDITVGLVSNAHGDRGELLQWVLLALGQHAPEDASYVSLFSRFQAYLIEEYNAGRRTILIFDEAQNLSEDTLEELRMFSNINADEDELVQLILVGQPELREKLASPKLVQFAQRVSSDFHLNSMSKLAVREYIDFRMLTSGATRNVFTEDAAAAIHEATGGVPRLINQLCDYSLLYAFGEGVYRVDRNMIETVVEDRNVNGSFAPLKTSAKAARSRGRLRL